MESNMNFASFFQKYDDIFCVALFKSAYIKFFLRGNERRIKYLRDAGARIGDNTYIGRIEMLGSEPYLVDIGNNTYFSGGETLIVTHDGSISLTYNMGIAPKKYDVFGRVKVGDNCFIGARCIILRGVTIGDNCVIGAGSIVTKDIPSGSVACGVPAKVIGTSEQLFVKNSNQLVDTIGWNKYKKREYLEQHFILNNN